MVLVSISCRTLATTTEYRPMRNVLNSWWIIKESLNIFILNQVLIYLYLMIVYLINLLDNLKDDFVIIETVSIPPIIV